MFQHKKVDKIMQKISSTPSISLPKGGGAIRGIDEKFSVNPVTGTGSFSIPIPVSPARSEFTPQLSLSYNSGSGNGPFGLGWSLSLPSITRKTDKGLPRYDNVNELDVFILSGAEDLVPVLDEDGKIWEEIRTVNGVEYTIRRYRPRIEGLFARIERWTRTSDGDIHWRSISKDNILTIYGRDENSRIADPEDPNRIFSWLISETRDDRGNAIIYEYKPEDSDGVNTHLLHERNRTEKGRSANSYIKRIKYGNRTLLFDAEGRRPAFLTWEQIENAGWMFEIVFDYGEHEERFPKPEEDKPWPVRPDPFSTYKPGFEVRTYRLCQRILMFHHLPGKDGYDGLVRSLDFTYSYEEDPFSAENPVYSFLSKITQKGYKRSDNSYIEKSYPPLEFAYSRPEIQERVEKIEPESLENLPSGLDEPLYHWIDLHGEGIPGILTEQGGAWFYKRNLSPVNERIENGQKFLKAKFALVEQVSIKPSAIRSAQFMDLAGDGQLDLVSFEESLPGFYEHDEKEGWKPFNSFSSELHQAIHEPNARFIDLDGDGRADLLITEEDAFVWYRSLGEAGFAPAEKVSKALDEEKGPRIVFADKTQTIFLADMSGDGLTDIVRIRNGEVCYWPNLGFGRFGAKVTMENSPWFDNPDQFDPSRIRLADVDGSGTTDIIYLHRDGVRIYFNQSGNGWSKPKVLNIFPPSDRLSDVQVIDLLGNGTACIVRSSPLPGYSRTVRYVPLMGAEKPHFLVGIRNNLGAETRIYYAPSTKFYLQDRLSGKPWITKLPFPVHVVERVETYDHISKNRFVTRYAYHHGYFDGHEREFRGFGMVEQWDTGEFGAFKGAFPSGNNWEESSHIPPVLTKTWFHTGAYIGREKISRYYEDEYYRGPGLSEEEVKELLLPDTVLPEGLTPEEEREACRALKGMMLRQEVYALDGTEREKHPYTVVEQNFAINVLQRRGENPHAIFFVHPKEIITYHYERNPSDPRIQHSITLEVDEFGNVLKEVAIGYGRKHPPQELEEKEKEKQKKTLITYTENLYTNAIDEENDYCTPLPAETRTYELTGYTPSGPAGRFQASDFVRPDGNALHLIYDSEIPYEETPTGGRQCRLIEHHRTLYRRNDLTGLLPLGRVESLALPGETYTLAFTPGLIEKVFRREGESLIQNPSELLEGKGRDRGGYVFMDGCWWIHSGRVFYSPDPEDTPEKELAEARAHFFLPRRFEDPFGNSTTVTYDNYDLLVLETCDALGNKTTAGERDREGNIIRNGNDYRVLKPWLVSDANRNRTAVAFDALRMVVGTAVMGKTEEDIGDSLEGFEPDLDEETILEYINNPFSNPHALLKKATSRFIYDLFAYLCTKDGEPQPAVSATITRETHESELSSGEKTKLQLSFSYSDSFGRIIQKKIQAEPGPVPKRDEAGRIVVGADGQPEMTDYSVEHRWMGTGWVVFNNKGKPVRKFEPFFTDTHLFEFDVKIGVSPVLFYDPLGRVVATLHPNHSWEKVVFDPWRQESWDVNDTVLINPLDDPDVRSFFERLPADMFLPTWYQLRRDPQYSSSLLARYPEAEDRTREIQAAEKTEVHAGTPAVSYFDVLGRTFLTVSHNRFKAPDGTVKDEKYRTLIEFDIEGNVLGVIDAKGRIVMCYSYHMAGPEEDEDEERRNIHFIHQASMEAGERWILSDVEGNPIRIWDSRGFVRRICYDELRRPTDLYVAKDGVEYLVERTVYGEEQGDANNLRTRVYRQYDQTGVVTNRAYDFKGNLIQSERRLAVEYKETVDWNGEVQLEEEIFETFTDYDALNRAIKITTPDGSITYPGYNEANLLEKVEVRLRGEEEKKVFVKNINYNAKGQRELIEYGNGAVTLYEYDSLTFRLRHLKTARSREVFQDLYYTYDPDGNITHIRDAAQQTIYFRNSVVRPDAEYTYDALYRLVEAKGREHIGQAGVPTPSSWDDRFRVKLAHPNDGNAMRRYTEQYEYDEVGNILRMIHKANSNGSWTREYFYEEESFLEPDKFSNRLSKTEVGERVERYTYDEHGNMTTMPHLSLMKWDYEDRLKATSRQVRTDGGTPEITYYVYNSDGERVRKVTERDNGARKEDRIYLGGFEIYRKYNGSGSTMNLERETLHILDDQERIALVETRTVGDDGSARQLVRYQLGNHLGSVILELDDNARLISYEEYSPYGSTVYQAVDKSIKAAAKRYRFTGQERDEETGLNYHKARYYALWLGRWVSCDPVDIKNDINIYSYSMDTPLTKRDREGTQSEAICGVPGPSELECSQKRFFERLSPQKKNALVVRYQQLLRAIVRYRQNARSGWAWLKSILSRNEKLSERLEKLRQISGNNLHWLISKVSKVSETLSKLTGPVLSYLKTYEQIKRNRAFRKLAEVAKKLGFELYPRSYIYYNASAKYFGDYIRTEWVFIPIEDIRSRILIRQKRIKFLQALLIRAGQMEKHEWWEMLSQEVRNRVYTARRLIKFLKQRITDVKREIQMLQFMLNEQQKRQPPLIHEVMPSSKPSTTLNR